MKKLSLIVHQNYLEHVIQTLHESGIVQLIDITKENPEILEETITATKDPEAATITNYELRLARLIDILKSTQTPPSGIKAMLNPQTPEKKTTAPQTIEELYSQAESILINTEQDILDAEEQLKTIDEQLVKITNDITNITYLKAFDIDVSDLGPSTYTFSLAGITPDLPTLEKNINDLKTAALFSHSITKGKNKEWVVLAAVHKSEQDLFDRICRDYITPFSLEQYTGTPQSIVTTLEEQQKEHEQHKESIKKTLQKDAQRLLLEIQSLREELAIERVRREIPQSFVKTEKTYLIQGWVLERNQERLKDLIQTSSQNHAMIEFITPSPNPDNPPVHLDVPRWATGFQGLLQMFATPRYNELNPTLIMGIFFVLFFCVMLGDAGYGLMIFFLSILGYYRLGKHSWTIRTLSFMGILMGIGTTIVGILTYSIFGDLIHRFFYGNPPNPIYSFSMLGIQFPIEPLREPLTILTVALLLGLIHMNIGVVLGLIQSARQKQYKELFTERFCWVPLQIGGGLLIGTFILDWAISETMIYIAAVLVLIGIILLLIASGPVGFFDITGYVGDWLSYARLLALGLATAGMALAFNVVSQLIGEMIPIVGVVVMGILLMLTHVINLGLQALGAAVHSLRLQYVEFFNRFYQGGGKRFSPFRIRRRFTILKKE